MTLGLFGGAALAAIAWVTFVPSAGTHLVLNDSHYPVDLEKSPAQAITESIEIRSKQLLRQDAYLRVEGESYRTTLLHLGFSVDEESARRKAALGLSRAHVSMSEDPLTWFARRFSSRPERFELTLKPTLSTEQAEAVLTALAKEVDTDPTDARMLIAEHTIVPSEEGLKLSVAASLVRLGAMDFEDVMVFEPVVDKVRPHVTEDDLAPVDITRVLSSFETSFRGKAGARAVNIRAAARYLNGAIILPGEVLSFNDQVGRRIHARGFVDAPVILNDELELDVGGGVCQVATTLHGAAVYGDLEVVNRRSHSRPSGYAPLGLDATVIDGKVDLKLRNNFDEPVLVYVSFPSTHVIRVELLGRDPDVQVEHAYTVTHREPFERRVWRREEVPLGGFEQKQKGSEGMDVVSVLRIKHKSGEISRRSYHSKYYPVPEVFWVAGDANMEQLPGLPEGATGVSVDGGEVKGGATNPKSETETKTPDDTVPTFDEADGTDHQSGPKNTSKKPGTES